VSVAGIKAQNALDQMSSRQEEMKSKRLDEVQTLKRHIEAEIELCERTWVYVLLKCKGMAAQQHRDSAILYFQRYDGSGHVTLQTLESGEGAINAWSELHNRVDNGLTKLYAQLKQANIIIASERK
jgi:hypothetical protein